MYWIAKRFVHWFDFYIMPDVLEYAYTAFDLVLAILLGFWWLFVGIVKATFGALVGGVLLVFILLVLHACGVDIGIQ